MTPIELAIRRILGETRRVRKLRIAMEDAWYSGQSAARQNTRG
jgi:hypothetical protein